MVEMLVLEMVALWLINGLQNLKPYHSTSRLIFYRDVLVHQWISTPYHSTMFHHGMNLLSLAVHHANPSA